MCNSVRVYIYIERERLCAYIHMYAIIGLYKSLIYIYIHTITLYFAYRKELPPVSVSPASDRAAPSSARGPRLEPPGPPTGRGEAAKSPEV